MRSSSQSFRAAAPKMKRLLLITLALSTLGCATFAVSAIENSGKRPRFTLVVTPARQSAVRGAAARFSVDVPRSTNFTGAIKLRVARLPRGMRARWQLADGTRSRVVPLTETGAVLTLRTSSRTPFGPRRVKVIATGGGRTAARRLTLTVTRRRPQRFSLSARPARQTVAQGAPATYKVRVRRFAGFRGRVMLRALRLPRGARATWSRRVLTVSTAADQQLGSDRLVIRGISRVRGRAVRRYAVVVLTVVRARQIPIAGELDELLYPGSQSPLDLVLTNPHPFDIRVVALSVSVGAGTTHPGCAGANYAVTQYSGGFPLLLHKGSTRLSALVVDSSLWPQVAMHNLPTNQDACQGAVLSLDYRGLATR